jgi:hypothetical protein
MTLLGKQQKWGYHEGTMMNAAKFGRGYVERAMKPQGNSK